MATKSKTYYYKLDDSIPILKEVFEEFGWEEINEGGSNWNIYWRSSRFSKSEYESCKWSQRLNHFPKTAIITRKDSLLRHLKTLKAIYGQIYNYFPQSFCCPTEFKKFLKCYQELNELGEQNLWISKPSDSSRGRGIFLFKNIHELVYDCSTIVQRYVDKPFLISNFKFDLRCYVLVRSYHPLNIYIYNEGLTRFATYEYDLNDLGNSFSHLTNTSINKHSPSINLEKEDIGKGCKWNFEKLKDYFNNNLKIDFSIIWKQIIANVLLTIVPIAKDIPKTPTGCFELYGFDFIIDQALKTLLLEVNLSPSLGIDCETDIQVKKELLRDLIYLVDIPISELEEKSKKEIWTPKICGKFQKIYPNPDIPSSLEQSPPKVGDQRYKKLLNEIKTLYL